MIVILEGPDGSGKTTLARQLQERYGLEYHHEGVPPADVHPLTHYGRVLHGLRNENVVIDRLALGERVYGPFVRSEDRLGPEGWKIFQRLVSACGARQLVCLPPVDVCYRSWKDRKGELFSEDWKLYRAYAEYGYHALNEPYRLVRYDWTRTSFDELTYSWREPVNLRYATVVGSLDAEVLFVGERVNGDLDLPFFATWGSSKYLNDAIERAGLYEHEIAFVNAFNVDGERNLIPRGMKTIALGKVAALACQDDNIPHAAIPHPQFWKRFHHHDVYGYARLIKESAR